MDEIRPEEDFEEGAWNPDWMELTSVGIDIGSSTSHLMFSRLLLQRRSIQLSSRFVVVHREILHRSPILLTPYLDPETIDTEQLAQFINRSYAEADIDPTRIDTGAVICTGEAVRKKNAEAITRLFSGEAGKFVCATAGPNLEAALAAHGSGAVALSDSDTILNVDLGGGTSKLAVVRDKGILDTAAINVGARLVAWDPEGRVARIEEAGAKVARSVGIELALGRRLSLQEKTAMAEALAELLIGFVKGQGLSPLGQELLITSPPAHQGKATQVVFSGGVSEYVYGREERDYGDLGPLLGEAIRRRIPSLGLGLREPVEGIRATVIGASQYTVQVSSSTVFVSREGVLPIRDRLVVTPRLEGDLSPQEVAEATLRALERFDLLAHPRPVAFSLRWPREPSYASLRTLALGLVQATAQHDSRGDPLVLVFPWDIGGLVGALLKEELALEGEVVAVDEIDVGDFDFIDIGEELGHSAALPVVVKSLVFG